MSVNFTASFQAAFGTQSQFNAFLNFCRTSPLLKSFIDNSKGTIDVTRDGTPKNDPLPGGGTSSNATLISVDPSWLPLDAKGNKQGSALSYALLATALAHEFGHQSLPDGRSTGIFNTASVSDAILAGEKAESAAFTAEYVVAQQRLPTVDAIASYGRNYTSGNNTNPLDYGTNAHIKQAGVQFSLPILDGGGIHAHVAEARAREHKAESDLEAARREAIADAREAYQGVLKGVAQVKALSAAIDASENSVKGSQAGYRAGLRINSDVLDAEREHYSARRDWSRARYDTLLQFLKLKAAAGALQRSDLTLINSMLASYPE